MTKSIGIIAAYSKPEAADLAVRIKDQLQSMGCDVVAERELAQATPQTLAAIIVLGGDGLMMRAASMYPDIPLFGINFGKVGFLAMVEQRDWLIAVNASWSQVSIPFRTRPPSPPRFIAAPIRSIRDGQSMMS